MIDIRLALTKPNFCIQEKNVIDRSRVLVLLVFSSRTILKEGIHSRTTKYKIIIS